MDLSSKHGQITSVVAGAQTSDIIIRNDQSDGDIKIYGNDGGTDKVLVTLDSSVPQVIANVQLSATTGITTAGAIAQTGTVTNSIDLSAATITNILKVADGQGAVVGAMPAKSPENDAEAGYLKIIIGSTVYHIPFYASA